MWWRARGGCSSSCQRRWVQFISALHYGQCSATASLRSAAGAPKVSASIFGKLASEDILDQASGLSSSRECDAIKGGKLEIWGWGCNARGQLGPWAPSAVVVVQPQRLHVMQSSACLDSISVFFCCEEARFNVDAATVAGLHHTALFTREITAGGAPAAPKGMDVVRCHAAPLSFSLSASQIRHLKFYFFSTQAKWRLDQNLSVERHCCAFAGSGACALHVFN
jgi:hypothetical protein